MVAEALQKIDDTLIQIGETLGELHEWLDNPRQMDLDHIVQTLTTLPISQEHHFLDKKRNSLIRHVRAMQSFQTDNFTTQCTNYFENLVPSQDEVAYAEKILQEQKKEEDEKEKLPAFEVARRIQEAIKQRKLEDRIEVCYPYGDSSVVSIQPYVNKPAEIRISEKVQKSACAIQKTIAHEIEGHAYRLLNGLNQFPRAAFCFGTSAAYLLTEEGVTHQAEHLNGFASNDRIAAGHVIAVNAMLQRATQSEIENLLIDKGILAESAKNIAKRAKRGVDQNQQGGYVGGAAYLLGRIRVNAFLEQGGSLNTLYVGKISLEDVPRVEEMLQAGELKEPTYVVKNEKKI